MPTFGQPTYAGRHQNGGEIVVPVPGDISDGDLLIVALRSQDSINPWEAPDGFVSITSELVPDPGTRSGAIFVKTVENAAEELRAYTFSGAWNRAVAIAIAMTPDGTDPIVNISGGKYGGVPSAGGNSAIAAHTLTNAPALSFLAVGAECTHNLSHVPTIVPPGFTELGNTQSSLDDSTIGSRTVIWLGWREEPDTEVERLEAQYEGATAVAMYLATFTGDSTGEFIPPIPDPGFHSVAQMLATPGATWAHRGGSNNWPEMSKLAYTNSALEGYGALEFSCGRSSDGVWFGLHDTSLNRTSETTGLPAASEMTWAQIQEYSISTRSNGNPQPYYRMTDFLDDWAGTHVVIMDIKYGWAHAQEWFDILSSYTDDRKRIIIKYFGPTSFSTQMQNFVRTSGFSSWGYYYPEQVANGDLERTQDRWSMLGMEYFASDEDWEAILSYGKPVVAHICQHQASYDQGMSKGAHMAQCAGVATINAVGPPEESTQNWDAIYTQGSRYPATSVYVGDFPVWSSRP